MDQEKEEKTEVVNAVENLISEDRVVSFSDAVFAFAATLLVLKIDLPSVTASEVTTQLPFQLIHLWPQYLANIISFLIIGYYWLNHHAIFGMLKRFNKTIVWVNLVFLIFLSFLPFPVDLYGDYPTVHIVIIFYSLSLAIVGYLLAGIWWYASSHNRLVDKNLSQRHIHYYMIRYLIAPIVFTLSVPLALIDPVISQFSWVFVILGIVLVNKLYRYKRMSEIEKMAV